MTAAKVAAAKAVEELRHLEAQEAEKEKERLRKEEEEVDTHRAMQSEEVEEIEQRVAALEKMQMAQGTVIDALALKGERSTITVCCLKK